MIQDLWRKIDSQLSTETLEAYGATLIAVSSLFNGVGRMFWGGISDRIGRVWTFRIMLGSQIAAFVLLTTVGNPWLFGALICYVLLCYGGGFGTMPAFVLDVFGSRLMAVAYGAILTAWSAGGIVGPQMIAFLKDHYPANAAALAFWLSAAVLGIGLLLAIVWRDENMNEVHSDLAQPGQDTYLSPLFSGAKSFRFSNSRKPKRLPTKMKNPQRFYWNLATPCANLRAVRLQSLKKFRYPEEPVGRWRTAVRPQALFVYP